MLDGDGSGRFMTLDTIGDDREMTIDRGTDYSGGRVPTSGFSDWPAQQKRTKKKVGH
jgi:hypothetical protein